MTFDDLDGRTLLAAAAALTDRVRIFFNLVVAPWHPPALLAKELASLDVVSKGRLIFGIGAGYLKHEFDAIGAPFDAKSARTTADRMTTAVSIIPSPLSQPIAPP